MTKYRWDPNKGFVTNSGRAISPNYRVGLSRTGKTVQVFDKQGRVKGTVANAKKSNLGPLMKPVQKGEYPISFDGASGQTWQEFQEDHRRVYGYEYH